MQGYVVSRPVFVRGFGQSKCVSAAAGFGTPAVTDVQIATAGEIEAVTQQLQHDHPDADINTLIRGLPHQRLAGWAHFPVPLGRLADPAGTQDESPILSAQLQALRNRHPARRRFRLLLANGFGTNLGDTLIGLTALRCVLPLLRQNLKDVTVDVMLGWQVKESVVDLFRQCEAVSTVFRQGCCLRDLSRYQALFDTTGLIKLRRYRDMAPVDWYLWWLGLDPAQIEPIRKRNTLALAPADVAAVDAQLVGIPHPRILLNPMASEPLRRMPFPFVKALTQSLLDHDPALHVIFDQPVKFEHPRVCHLENLIDSPGRLSALIAGVDGAVTTDTFVQHVADALNIPCCTLSASVPASHFQYYPFGRTLELPGARQLAGWGLTKVGTEDWQAMSAAYAEAWLNLPPQEVLDTLDDVMACRQRLNSAPNDRQPASAAPLSAPKSAGDQELLRPLGQLPDPEGAALQSRLFELGRQIVVSGDTVVILGAGCGEPALSFAARVAPTGHVLAFEHRRQIHQILCTNIVRTDHACVQAHFAMATNQPFAMRQTGCLDVDDDHLPAAPDNQPATEPVPSWPLDAMALEQCRLIVLQQPAPMLEALGGARETLARLRPTVLALDVARERLPQWHALLGPLAYRVRVVTFGAAGQPLSPASTGSGRLVVIAEPLREPVQLPEEGKTA